MIQDPGEKAQIFFPLYLGYKHPLYYFQQLPDSFLQGPSNN